MVLFTQDNQWADAIKGVGSVLGQALQQRGQKLQEQQQMNAIFGNQQPTAGPGRDLSSGPGIQRISDDQLTMLVGIPKWKAVAEAELKRRELATKRDEAAWNYRPTQKYLEGLEEKATDAEFANEVADQIIELAPSVDPKNFRTFLASQFGEKLPLLFDEQTSQLKFLEKLQAKGLKNYFPRPTEREFFFINAAQAQLGKTPEANIAVANLQKKFNNIPIQAAKFADEVIQENNGIPPRDLPAKVRDKMKAYKDSLINDAAEITAQFGDAGQKKKAESYFKSVGDEVEGEEEVSVSPQGESVQAEVTAINPQTGQRIVLREGKWVPAQ